MAGHLASVPHTPRDENIQTPPISREILEILFEVVPHMPTESQESFVSMLRDNDSNPPSHGALKVPPRRPHLSLLPDSLHNYVQEKTYVYDFRHSYVFNLFPVFSIYPNLI